MINVKLLEKLEKLDEKKAKYLRIVLKIIHKLIYLYFGLWILAPLTLESKVLENICCSFAFEFIFVLFLIFIYENFFDNISRFVYPNKYDSDYDDDNHIISGWYE